MLKFENDEVDLNEILRAAEGMGMGIGMGGGVTALQLRAENIARIL